MSAPLIGSNSQQIIHHLIREQEQAKKNELGWKQACKNIAAKLAEIVQPERFLEAAGKMANGGSTTVEENGVKYTVEAEKDVKWDSAKLQNIAARMPWPMVEAIFKIKFEITEAAYKNCQANAAAGMLDKQVMALIDEARTVTIKEAKITKAEIIS